mgnify:FL=1|tara:strand:+ start:717 stop:1028 length:312 start_codon:yes stop_codon:yes gene_type:complete
MENLIEGISKYGFPIMAACGLGYFVFYIWNWVTKEIKPVIDDAMSCVINLIDKVRMLDNDMIRLMTKINLILEENKHKENEKISIVVEKKVMKNPKKGVNKNV